MEDKLLEFAAKALNMTTEEVKETITEDGGLETLSKAYADHVKTVKDSGFKAGERKVNSAWEAKIKTEFDLQSDTKGISLLDEVQQVIEEKAATPPKDISEAHIKKHPKYLELEKQLQEAEKTYTERYQKQIAEKEEAWQQKELFGEVKTFGKSFIKDTLKANLATEPSRQNAQLEDLMEKLQRSYNFQKNGKEFILLNKETGERENNEQGFPVKLEDVLKTITTTYYDLQAAEERSSTGNKETAQQHSVNVPKNEEEFVKMMNDSSIPVSERRAASNAYHASNQ